MAIKFKPKQKIELFKILQEAFFVNPQQDGNFTIKKDDEGLIEFKWTITGKHDYKGASSSLLKRMEGIFSPANENMIFGVETVKIIPEENGVFTVKSENTNFQIDKKFDIFAKEDLEVLKVLAARCIDYKLIASEIKKLIDNGTLNQSVSKDLVNEDDNGNKNVTNEDNLAVEFRFIPKDTLALRIFINSAHVYLGAIDISNITDLTYAFSIYDNARVQENPRKDFSGIEKWDTSKVTKMLGVFAGCVNFNHDISSWNTSNVTNTEVMFASCRKFNQDLSWMDVSKVESMKGMFYRCDIFDQDLSSWKTNAVKDMSYMFFKCKKFSHDISMWATDKLTNDENMFLDCDLTSDKKPRSPSSDFKRQYFERYIGPNAKKHERASNIKKLGIAAAFVALVIAFSLFNGGQV